ncbi:6-phosphogluconolactonase [Tsukamurella soli]|uniref:6-phosphogluconolactonase n=1 Tax=Tsukamurella soli TaxID=644556 RepID=A0ABP8J0J2_9ACTN
MTTVKRYADPAELARVSAADLTAVITAAQAARGFASIVVTGGSNGIAILRELRSADIDWSRVDVFYGDERFVRDGDPDRNDGQADEALFSHVRGAHVYRYPTSDEFEGDMELAARVYAEQLARNARERGFDGPVPSFDVHLLGMGPEGHINSLFPHTAAVREKKQLVVSVSDSPKPPPKRLTLTLPAVAFARQVWFLVSGEAKAEAVAAGVGGADPDDWPCAGARGADETVWYIDEAAASKLPA